MTTREKYESVPHHNPRDNIGDDGCGDVDTDRQQLAAQYDPMDPPRDFGHDFERVAILGGHCD